MVYVRSWDLRSKLCNYAYILGVFDLKRRGSDRSVFDVKVPREHFEIIRNRLYGTLMSYTNRSAHANKAKT